MAIDRKALAESYQGDPDKKVAVTKVWLKAVHYELAELDNLRKADVTRKAAARKVKKDLETFDTDREAGQRAFDEGFEKFDQGFKKTFEGRGWRGLFGK